MKKLPGSINPINKRIGQNKLTLRTPSVTYGRFQLAAEGKVHLDLSWDIIALNYDDTLETTEINVNDWGYTNNGVDYKYRNGGLLELGTRISLFATATLRGGPIKMSEGTIVSISPLNPDGGPPTLTFVVRGEKQPASNNSLSLTYGQELKEFKAILKEKENVIEGTGLISGIMPTLRTGAAVNINGLGHRFDGTYTVTGTVYSYDGMKGPVTHFSAERIMFHRLK